MINLKIIIFIFITLFCFDIYSFPIPKNGEVKFDVIRKNKVIGSHEITFAENDDVLTGNDLRNISKDIKASQRMLSMKNGFIKIADYSTAPLPYYLKDGSIMSIENAEPSVEYSHTSDKKKPHDLIPLRESIP